MQLQTDMDCLRMRPTARHACRYDLGIGICMPSRTVGEHVHVRNLLAVKWALPTEQLRRLLCRAHGHVHVDNFQLMVWVMALCSHAADTRTQPQHRPDTAESNAAAVAAPSTPLLGR